MNRTLLFSLMKRMRCTNNVSGLGAVIKKNASEVQRVSRSQDVGATHVLVMNILDENEDV